MALVRRRGRPRTADSQAPDLGTVELRRHRQGNHTMEPIDILRQQDVINDQEHWCAIHFRWLYTLRYGSATVAAVDPARTRGILHKKVYSDWQQERETEWKHAIDFLQQHHLYDVLLNITVHHKPPESSMEKQRVVSALQLLCDHWCKS